MLERLLGRSGAPALPVSHRRNFLHLYLDFFWLGLFNGSITVFLAVYISRLGATPLQTGLLTAAPALMNLLFTLPASSLIRRRPTHTVMRAWVLATRLFYILLIPLPVLLPAHTQVWVIIAMVLVLNIPGTVVGVINTAWLAESAPAGQRGQVVGTRNALFSITSMLTSLAVGRVLAQPSFATSYQVVFTIGVVGLVLSTLHVFFVKPLEENAHPSALQPTTARPGFGLNLDILKGPFRWVLLIMFVYQVGTFLSAPIFPLYQVRVLKMSDQTISLGSALFWVIHALVSTRAGWLARRIGFKRMFGFGVIGSSLVTLLFSISFQGWVYAFMQVISGISWALIGAGVINYLLEKVPPEDRNPYLAWYNLVINAAVLLCGLAAPQIAARLDLLGCLILTVGVRLLAGFIILKLG